MEKGIKISERANEVELEYSHNLTGRKDCVYLFVGISLKISQLPENVINGT